MNRTLGETIRSRTGVAQENKILAEIVCYKPMVLIQEFFEHGVSPDFLIDPSVLEAAK